MTVDRVPPTDTVECNECGLEFKRLTDDVPDHDYVCFHCLARAYR